MALFTSEEHMPKQTTAPKMVKFDFNMVASTPTLKVGVFCPKILVLLRTPVSPFLCPSCRHWPYSM